MRIFYEKHTEHYRKWSQPPKFCDRTTECHLTSCFRLARNGRDLCVAEIIPNAHGDDLPLIGRQMTEKILDGADKLTVRGIALDMFVGEYKILDIINGSSIFLQAIMVEQCIARDTVQP